MQNNLIGLDNVEVIKKEMKSIIYRTAFLLAIGILLFLLSCTKEDCIPELHSPSFKIIFVDSLTNQPQTIEFDSLEIISHTKGFLQDFGELFPPNYKLKNDTLLLDTDPHILSLIHI